MFSFRRLPSKPQRRQRVRRACQRPWRRFAHITQPAFYCVLKSQCNLKPASHSGLCHTHPGNSATASSLLPCDIPPRLQGGTCGLAPQGDRHSSTLQEKIEKDKNPVGSKSSFDGSQRQCLVLLSFSGDQELDEKFREWIIPSGFGFGVF